MKVIIAPDSFKGSLSAPDVANSINKGVKKAYAGIKTVLLPVADGGEGTLETLISATNGKTVETPVIGPMGDEINASYGILGDGKTCIIEMATASGFMLVSENKLSPLQATTFGTGQLIKKALDDGFSSFIITLGGSATNDGGVGMLQALGMKILDAKGRFLSYGGGYLNEIDAIDVRTFDKRIKKSKFVIASDVQNPLTGLNGASHIFGPQKGASSEDIKLLDDNLSYWADKVAELTGIYLHNLPGAGAAGGLGGALKAFFSAEIKRGIDVVLDYIKLNDHLLHADLVITGEGCVDHQTNSGKTPLGVAQAAKKENVPTIILTGTIGNEIEKLYDYGVVSVNSIIDKPMSLNESMSKTSQLLERSAEQITRSYFYNCMRI
ncbi:glycerate kinase [Oceanobacillus timonensis]|uniref:glycerate kinase n=1 Tax=Oceanobacillus timonensis TaxID=1926285 RepID=UPI0009BB833E|nr:glycerate kinase [Oceanobacillus timonensis]